MIVNMKGVTSFNVSGASPYNMVSAKRKKVDGIEIKSNSKID